MSLTIGHYLNHVGKLTDQFFESKDNYKDKNRQRIYMKDIDCPTVWLDKLKEIIPTGLFYWNDSIGTQDDPGATAIASALHGAVSRRGKGIAPAGDLMSSMPQEMRAENLMAYIGHEGTYTATHREMCASLGQNIMVHSSKTVDENGNPQKTGSSIWFMTDSAHRNAVSEYFLSVLGHDLELENHFAQISAWQRAPFPVYLVDQKVGDFVLVPPLAPHQVWNRGTCTIKVAWNRTTVDTLRMALDEALQKSRLVCRDEQYKNKSMIYYSLMKYHNLLRKAQSIAQRSPGDEHKIKTGKKIRQLKADFKSLFNLFKQVMLSEMFAPNSKETCEFIPFDSNVTCSYCRSNIFNRFLTCKTCPSQFGGEDPYDMCMDCFVMGRSCRCQSKFKWVEQFKWRDLCERYEDWRRMYIDFDQGMTGATPCTLTDERQMYPKKTLAQICQEQLKIRPWVDITKGKDMASDSDEEEEVQMNADGTVKGVRKKKSQAFMNRTKSCHSCLKRHPKWSMAHCKCERSWCYGTLYRAHDLFPHSVMEDPNWECPHCRGVCSTGACRKDHNQTPYHPQKTVLGHDTKKVADLRSQECLVDFSVSNLSWIREIGGPLERARLEGNENGSHTQDVDGFMDVDAEDQYADAIQYSPVRDAIDPALGGGSLATPVAEEPTELSLDQPDDLDNNPLAHSTSVYPDLDAPQHYVNPSSVSHELEPIATFNAINATPLKGRKRKQDEFEPIKLIEPKKRKVGVDESTPGENKASKQYKHEQSKKLLEQAKKEGRYLVVWSKLHKKQALVTLELPPETLRSFKEHEVANRMKKSRSLRDANVLLRSDIITHESNDVSATKQPQAQKTKVHRVRAEPDADFNSRHRKKPTGKPQYEEIEEDEEDFEDYAETMRPSVNTPRRRPAEGLVELPNNWKDGQAARPRNRKSEPGKRTSIAQKTPRIRPRHSTGKINQEDSDEVEEEPEEEPEAASDSTAGANAMQLARLTVEEKDHRLAKLQAAQLAAGDEDDEDEGFKSAAEEILPASNSTKQPKALPTMSGASGGSIFDRTGKKAKIVSGPSKRKGPPGRRTLPSV
jgi:hypothetical protein